MRYDESNLKQRISHFEYLNKLAINGKLSKEDSIDYINMLIKQNPYAYKTNPAVEVRNPDKNEKKEKTNGSYSPKLNKITFMLPKQNITLGNLRNSVYVVGHEMKHYYQHKNLSKYPKFMENYKNQYALQQFNLSNLESTTSYVSINKGGFHKIVKTMPLKASISLPILSLRMSKQHTNSITYATYYTTHHEYDARKAGENFAYGMMKSYANDPLIEKYPEVKKILSRYIDNNCEQADKSHKDILKSLEQAYKEKERKLISLNKSLTKLALKGHTPINKSIVNLTSHLLIHFYDKETILNVIETNLTKNKALSATLNYFVLLKCPKKDLKQFQELYVNNVLGDNFSPTLNVMLTNEQNQQIIDKVITKDKDLKELNKFTSDRYFKNILTDDYAPKLVDEIITSFKDENIGYQDLFSISMDLLPKLNKENSKKLDDFYKEKYNELEKRENGFNKNDFVVEYDNNL